MPRRGPGPESNVTAVRGRGLHRRCAGGASTAGARGGASTAGARAGPPPPMHMGWGSGGYRQAVPLRAAVWDLGSSSFHLLVCEVGPAGRLRPVLRRRALLNLGGVVGERGEIPPERVAAAVAAARRLRHHSTRRGADISVALATAALRDASNGADIVARLERVIGLPVRILDGHEEARLCFVGQRAGVWMPTGPSLGIDLGGGSLEVAVGDARSVVDRHQRPGRRDPPEGRARHRRPP